MKIVKFFYGIVKRLSKRNEKVTNSKIEKDYFTSDRVEAAKETRKPFLASPVIDNGGINNNELNRLKPVSFPECVRVLLGLVKGEGLYNNEEFYQVLQNKYKGNLGPLDFQKVKSKLAQAGLLTKTISDYFPTQLTAINSIEPCLLDEIPTLIQSGKWSKDLYINQSFKGIVTLLTKRERDILFKRYFIEKPQSLKIVGQYYNLSRERIRQIEEKTLIKLRGKGLHIMFLFELIRLGSPSILSIKQLVTINKNLKIESKNLLCSVKIMQKIVNFNFYFLGNKFIYLQYKNYPAISKLSVEKWMDETHIPKEEFKCYLIKEGFDFLTEYEFELIYNNYSEQHHNKASLKDLIIRSLKLIGCPAHYSDITEKVMELGGEKYKNYSYNSVHGALNQYDEFVWVGKKGVYGLKEWGLSPPDKSLEDQVYSILRNSEKPLSKENIATELSKQRPYFTKTSLDLILSTNDKIIKTPDNLYHAANEEDIKAGKFKKAHINKLSNIMEEVFKEWGRQKNSEQ